MSAEAELDCSVHHGRGVGSGRPAALVGCCGLRAVCEAACPPRVWGGGRGGGMAAARGVVDLVVCRPGEVAGAGGGPVSSSKDGGAM